ncbi:hypothetical protein T484DRAFT_1666283, partial [Baffinella frigidus]
MRRNTTASSLRSGRDPATLSLLVKAAAAAVLQPRIRGGSLRGATALLLIVAGLLATATAEASTCLNGTYSDGSSGCVPCETGTFKPFDGPDACLSCPGDAVSVEGAKSCVCAAGHVFEHNIPSVRCSGSCPCTPAGGHHQGLLTIPLDDAYGWSGKKSCTWIISGAAPRVAVAPQHHSSWSAYAYVDECKDAECVSYTSIGNFYLSEGYEYLGATAHLRVRFEWYAHDRVNCSLAAEWSTTEKLPECAPCEAGTFKDATDASGCTACPTNAVSAEGSTALSSCECPAGYTGNTGMGESCVECEADTYKDASGSATCSACPPNSVSAYGSTGRGSCFCPAGYTGDAGQGEECVACEAGKFKPFDGPDACVSCPVDGVSAEGARSCGCGAGYFFKHNVPSVRCEAYNSRECSCTPSVGVSEGAMFFDSEAPGGNQHSWDGRTQHFCSFMISGAEPRVSIASSYMVQGHGSASIYIGEMECEADDAECDSWGRRAGVLDFLHGDGPGGQEYQSSTGLLGVMYRTSVGDLMYLNATWSTTSKPPACAPCEAGTYNDATDASGCTACPTNAVSAEGSTALSSCECPAGYTGNAGVGESCVECEADTYKDASGSATKPPTCAPCEAGTFKDATDASECTACPTDAVSAEGSTALSSCECPAGYTGNAGEGEGCVRCEGGTYKDVSGLGECSVCPTNSVSAYGSTGRASCRCAEGYTGDAGSGAECVACVAGTFKTFNGSDACVSCPVDGASAEGASGCGCGAGYFFEHRIPNISCHSYSYIYRTPACQCNPSVGVHAGTITSVIAGAYAGIYQQCQWTISGADPRVTITSADIRRGY